MRNQSILESLLLPEDIQKGLNLIEAIKSAQSWRSVIHWHWGPGDGQYDYDDLCQEDTQQLMIWFLNNANFNCVEHWEFWEENNEEIGLLVSFNERCGFTPGEEDHESEFLDIFLTLNGKNLPTLEQCNKIIQAITSQVYFDLSAVRFNAESYSEYIKYAIEEEHFFYKCALEQLGVNQYDFEEMIVTKMVNKVVEAKDNVDCIDGFSNEELQQSLALLSLDSEGERQELIDRFKSYWAEQ